MKKKLTDDQQLLLKDLYGRMLYHVKVQYRTSKAVDLTEYMRSVRLVDCRPYLRLMSSMTPEESAEYAALWAAREPYMPGETTDYLNEHMFDWRGLIPRGLAIAVTEEFNPYREKL